MRKSGDCKLLDLKPLKSFVAVADRLNLSRAAIALNISQSALSRQIQGLEDDLGFKLFDRVGRRLVLTAEGDDLLPRAAALLDQAASLSSRIEAMVRGEVGLLRIGATPQTIEGLLSPVLVGLRDKYPAIEISLIEGSNDFLLDQLSNGSAHVAIAALPESHEFESQPLFVANLYAIVPANYAHLAAQPTLDICQLADLPMLLLRKGFMTRKVFDQACSRAGTRVHCLIESDSTQTLFALAHAGHGVAIVSATAVAQSRADTVVPLTFQGKRLGQMIHVAWNAKRHKTSVLNPFLRELNMHRDRFLKSLPG